MSFRNMFVCTAILLSATHVLAQQPTTVGSLTHTFWDAFSSTITPATATTPTAVLTLKNLVQAPFTVEVTVTVEAPANISVYDTGMGSVKTVPFPYKVTVTNAKASDPNISYNVPYYVNASVGVPTHDSKYCYQETTGSASSVNVSVPTVTCSVDVLNSSPTSGAGGGLIQQYYLLTTINFGWAWGSGQLGLKTLYDNSKNADLAITGVSVVQVVHNSDELPLIAGKKTLARVFIKSTGPNAQPVHVVSAVLHGPSTPDPTPICFWMTAQPYSGSIPSTATPTADDFNVGTSVDFILPDAWVATPGPLTLTAEIVPPQGFQDSNPNNNKLQRTVTLIQPPKNPQSWSPPGVFRVGYFTISYQPPASSAGVVQAGPYFRSRAAGPGDGIIGGTSAGYWVLVTSAGEVRVRGLNPNAVIATTGIPASFNATVYHTLETVAQGSTLQVFLDGSRQTFTQNGAPVTNVALPATSGSNDGAVGIVFGDEDNRGRVGGQRAKNLVVMLAGS